MFFGNGSDPNLPLPAFQMKLGNWKAHLAGVKSGKSFTRKWILAEFLKEKAYSVALVLEAWLQDFWFFFSRCLLS